MSNELAPLALKIRDAVNSLEIQKQALVNEQKMIKKQFLEERVSHLERGISFYSKQIIDILDKDEKGLKVDTKKVESKEISSERFRVLSNTQKEQFIQDLNIDYDQLDDFVKEQTKKQKTKGLKKEDYSIYAPNQWGETANKYAKAYADLLVERYPNFFKPMFTSFERVQMPFLSRTYISLMLFFSVLSFPLAAVLFFLLNLTFQFSLILVGFIVLISPLITFAGFYFYPASLEGGRERQIRQELPFALVHMSAVAGSGAQPLSIFELLVNSKEYPELKKEIRKVMNYVNLFGYNLTNALRNVAKSTPSKELKELFNGMISTIDTGGDLRGYLKEKADDELNSYKLDRRKKVEALATYSEIYTAILIAAPLLLVISLAIMNNVGGNIGGMNISTIAYSAIGVALPVLNIGFMLFLTASQK